METFFWQTFRKKIGNGETGWTAKKIPAILTKIRLKAKNSPTIKNGG